jgi:hypothetical protein
VIEVDKVITRREIALTRAQSYPHINWRKVPKYTSKVWMGRVG